MPRGLNADDLNKLVRETDPDVPAAGAGGAAARAVGRGPVRRPAASSSSGVGLIVALGVVAVLLVVGAIVLVVVFLSLQETPPGGRSPGSLAGPSPTPAGTPAEKVVEAPEAPRATTLPWEVKTSGPLAVRIEELQLGHVLFRVNDAVAFKPRKNGHAVDESGADYTNLRNDIYSANFEVSAVELLITNTSGQPVDYTGWNVSGKAEMTDGAGRIYVTARFKQIVPLNIQLQRVTIEPGESIHDVLIFAMPPKQANVFTLELSGSNVGQSGPVRLSFVRKLFTYVASPEGAEKALYAPQPGAGRGRQEKPAASEAAGNAPRAEDPPPTE